MSTTLESVVRGRRPVTRSQTDSLPARKPSFAQEIQEKAGPPPKKSRRRKRVTKTAANNRASREDAARVHKKAVSRIVLNSHTAQTGTTRRRATAEELFARYNGQPEPRIVESGLRLLRNGVRETPQKSAEWTVAGHQKRLDVLGKLSQTDRWKAVRLRINVIEDALEAGDVQRFDLTPVVYRHLLAQLAYHVRLEEVLRNDTDALMKLPESLREKMRRSLLTCVDRETRPPVYFNHPQVYVWRSSHHVPKNYNLEVQRESPKIKEEEQEE